MQAAPTEAQREGSAERNRCHPTCHRVSASGPSGRRNRPSVRSSGRSDRLPEVRGDLGQVLTDRRLITVPPEVPERHAHVEEVVEEGVGQDGVAAPGADRREIAADDAAVRPR